MSRTTRGQKERSREQSLKHEGKELRNYIRSLEGQVRELEKENRRLRRQAAGSRKELAKMDLDRHSYVRDIVEEHLHQEETQDAAKLLETLKKKWACEDCAHGTLEIIVYTKLGEPWYYRQCDCCPKRTKSQKYSPEVPGILKK